MSYLSVVVTAYNSEKVLRNCLSSIRKSFYEDYELIVIDDGSTDSTALIIKEFTEQSVILEKNHGRNYVRSLGFQKAQGAIIVNIDSDVEVFADTLQKIADYFQFNDSIGAVTGILSKSNPFPSFFSQYKNMYMHYIFQKLSEDITFVYGSLFAVRKKMLPEEFLSTIEVADDTDLGQCLYSEKVKITLLKSLEIVHLKQFTFMSFLRNDFCIPYDWAWIFVKYKGWQQIGKKNTGFAHASKRQLLSIMLIPVILLFLFMCIVGVMPFYGVGLLFLLWGVLNSHFLVFLFREKGFLFGCGSILVTFLDNMVMGLGIFCGFVHVIMFCLPLTFFPQKYVQVQKKTKG